MSPEPPPVSGGCSWDELIARSGLPRLDARALLEHVSGKSRAWLLAHGEEQVPLQQQTDFESLGQRRARGEPLAYLVGQREFRGLRLRVGPEVLVPRPETEHLVEWALERGDALQAEPLRVLDLGTGSGAIALSVAQARPSWQITATDASLSALRTAQDNARALGLDGLQWRLGSWWEALGSSDAPFDLVLSNPPYLAADDPHLSDPALQHEPPAALVSGPLGLESLAHIAGQAAAHLRPGGWLMLEHGATQGAAVRQLLAQAGFEGILTRQDLAGLDRVTEGRRAQV